MLCKAAAFGLLAALTSRSAVAVKLSDVAAASVKDSPTAALAEVAESIGGIRRRKVASNRRRTSSERDGPVRMFDCMSNTGPLQVMQTCVDANGQDASGGGGYYSPYGGGGGGGGAGGGQEVITCTHGIHTLDPSTGKPSETPIMKAPAGVVLKGCQINPFDSVVYCIKDNYLARLGSNAFRYVAKLAATGEAATFGSDGAFYFEGSGYSGLYKVSGLDQLVDYETEADDGLTDFSDDDAIADTLPGAKDLLVMKGNFESGYGEKEYLVTLNVEWKVIVVRISGGPVAVWTLTTSGDHSGNPMGFDSGWSLENRAFFTEDTGMGTYEISDIDLAAKTATVNRVGESVMSKKGDGMQCNDYAKAPKEWQPAATTTLAPTTTTLEVRTPIDAEPGKCLVGFVNKNPCGCSSTVRCNKCSKKVDCSGRASAVTSNNDHTACVCTCEPGYGGSDCSIYDLGLMQGAQF